MLLPLSIPDAFLLELQYCAKNSSVKVGVLLWYRFHRIFSAAAEVSKTAARLCQFCTATKPWTSSKNKMQKQH